MLDPPRWTSDEFEHERALAIKLFRRERLEEPLEQYLEVFDSYHGDVENLFESTVDLTDLEGAATAFLSDPRLLLAFRYLAGPPISVDDLKTVAEARSLVASRLGGDAVLVRKIVEVVRVALDRRRFPWVGENREPTDSEKTAAIMATTALMATQRVGTRRRNEGKEEQERQVRVALQTNGFREVERRNVGTLANAPAPGEFCGESMLGSRKADFIIRLWDLRLMAMECKVSNSAVNSVKRLNNDAAAKARVWLVDFGERNIVPVAVLGGVFKLHNLVEAQNRGLTIFWAHDLRQLTEWIERTRA